MIEARTRRRRSVLRLTLADRYWARFGSMPAVLAWQGSPGGLDRLMARAIRRGRALSVRDLDRAQGLDPPPAGADW